MIQSYHYIPTNPLHYCTQIKRLLALKQIPLEDLEKECHKEQNYFKHVLDIHVKFAEGLKKFQEINKANIEETCKVCKITKEQYDMYMKLI